MVLFLPRYQREYDQYVKANKLADPKEAPNNWIDEFYNIKLNDGPTSLKFNKVKSNKTGQKGFETFIDISNLEKGHHLISIETRVDYLDSLSVRMIPFVKL